MLPVPLVLVSPFKSGTSEEVSSQLSFRSVLTHWLNKEEMRQKLKLAGELLQSLGIAGEGWQTMILPPKGEIEFTKKKDEVELGKNQGQG